MRIRSLILLTLAAAAAAALLVLPGSATVLEPTVTELPPAKPANLVGAQPGIDAATSAESTAAALLASDDLTTALGNVASPRARAIAADRAESPASLEVEVALLAAAMGRPLDPADVEAARAADPQVALATARLLSAIRVAADLREEALADLSASERVELAGAIDRALAAGGDRHLSAAERAEALAAFEAIEPRVDADLLAAAGLVVAGGVDDVLRSPPTTNGGSGDILLTLLGGLVHVGGPSASYYDTFNILVLDLGGPDEYRDTAGGVGPSAPFPISVVVDLDGNDVYNPGGGASYAADHVQGAAVLGVGVLVDVAGSDSYSSGMSIAGMGDVSYVLERSQGFGAVGVGILADLGGDDLYASAIRLDTRDGRAAYSIDLVQGAAAHGVGLLLDATGQDAYGSHNAVTIDVERGKAFATWTAQHCQGGTFGGGAAALVDGVLVGAKARLNTRDVDPRTLLDPANDAYNSWNSIVTTLATTESGFTGTTDGVAQMFNLNCQGATESGFDPTSPFPIRELNGAASLAVLVDVAGNDAFASRNFVRTVGVNRGGVEDSCAGCHLGASVTVRDSQGASSREVAPFEIPPLVGVHAGVMVDVLGNDEYNSVNSMIVDGIRFELRPGQTNAVSELEVNRSIGHAGLIGIKEPRPDGTRAGCGPAAGVALHECGVATCAPGGGEFQLDQVTPVGPSPKAPADCMLGIHLDLEGDDLYNSYNELAAREADFNEEKLAVEHSLGVGERGGIGVHVDGPVGGSAALSGTTTCSGGSLCIALIPVAARPLALAGGNDRVNSGNTALGASVFRLVGNLGNGEAGYGLAADVSPGATLGAFVVVDPSAPSGPLAATIALAAFSADGYDSDNVAPIPVVVRDSFGHATDGVGVFLDLAGWDGYVQNPASPPGDAWMSFGAIDGGFGAAVFADAGGIDAYPTVTPPPGPILFLAPGPGDETGWDSGTALIRIGWGLDQLSFL